MKRTALIVMIALTSQTLLSQHLMPEYKGEVLGTAEKISGLQAKFHGVVNPANSHNAKWMKTVNKIASYDHGSPDQIDSIKIALQNAKDLDMLGIGNDGQGRASTPVVGTNFLANSWINSTPPDNCIAISNGGKIMTVDNSTIAMYNDNSSALLVNEVHEDWFDDVSPSLSLFSSLFDPRVLYDPVSDRFIFIILHGSHSSTSKVLVCFSETNNPMGGWNVYEFPGNPLNDNSWLDYPQIGISANDLFITGNLFFNNGGGFNQSVVFQISKSQGYAGNSVSYDVYNNIPGGSVGSFSLVPASYGQGGEYGPGIYLVNSRSGGSNQINLYEVTNQLSANPSLNLNQTITVPQYLPSADALQLGSNEYLQTNDSRMQHAFYLNGIVHAVHHGRHNGTAYTGIKYYRIPVDNPLAVETATFGLSGFDYAYPAIASFGLEEIDRSVMISFLRSGSTIYPEMRVVNCDNEMEWSSSTLVREGDSYINHNWVNQYERWGDYSGLQRKHNAPTPEVWMAGCFGPNSNVWNTWVAEIKGEYEPAPVPVADFISDTTVVYQTEGVMFTDLSLNNPTTWHWSFEGGNPSASTLQHPSVTYYDTGFFEVSLAVENSFGADTLTQLAYIHVLSNDTAPEIPEEPESVEELRETNLGLKIYPNPARQFELIYIDVDNLDWSEMQIQVVDLNGRLVKVLYKDAMKPGIHRLSFNKMALSPGQYFIQVTQNGKLSRNEKIIVQ